MLRASAASYSIRLAAQRLKRRPALASSFPKLVRALSHNQEDRTRHHDIESESASSKRLKHPGRGGQNLSKRYERLERMLRGKEAYERQIEENEPMQSMNTTSMSSDRVVRAHKHPVMFRGFVVPEKPPEPNDDGE